MKEIQVTARLRIHNGKFDEFKALAAKMLEVVRGNESGTLQYDWFLSADQTECVGRERYRDSEAVLEHLANIGELLSEMMAIGDLEVEAYGSPSPELLEAAAGISPRIYAPFHSL